MLNAFSRRFLVLYLVLVVVSVSLQAQEQAGEKKEMHQTGHTLLMPTDLKWTDGPASLPKGTTAAVMEGDPSKPGPFTMRLKLPANYKIPSHWHPGIEHVTVLSGSFYMGLGESFDQSKASKLSASGFAVMQVGTRHFAFTKEEALIQLHGIGPWGITYVNPADDPRSQH